MRPFYIFALLFVVYRLLVVFFLPLVDDETYHWTWAKNLDISYFDHPGLIAWVEALTTAIFGDTRFGVRLPAFLFYFGTLFLMYQLCRDWFSERVAQITVVLFAFVPLWGLAGFVAAPELPFIFFWWLCIYIFWQGIKPNATLSPAKMWILLGLAYGLGLNSKLPIVLLAPGFFLFLLVGEKERKHLLTPWPYLGFILAMIMATPILLWNLQHDFPSFKYQFASRHQGQGLSLARWGQFLGYQLALISPGVYLGLVLGVVAAIKKIHEQNFRLLLMLAFPTLAIFYYQPLFADFKPHWSGPAYMTLLPLAAVVWIRGLRVGSIKILNPESRWLKNFALGFLLFMNVATLGPIFYPIIPKIYFLTNSEESWQPKNDFSNDLFGWGELGEHLKNRLDEIESAQGVRPKLAADRYELVSQVWYNTNEQAFMLSRDIHQFKFWQTPEAMENLKGKDFLVVATDKYLSHPQTKMGFESCEEEQFKTYRRGIHSRTFYIWHCRKFSEVL